MAKDLIALLKTNDQTALKELFDLYHTPLCLVAFRIVKDKDQAKDIVQDVFIKLWKNRQALQITNSLSAYLKRATINTALNCLERIANSNNIELEKSDLTSHAQNTTDQEQGYSELKQRADYAIERLPIRTKTVFVLIRFEEMSYKEVSETLNISLKAVEKEMMKALRLLREALKDYLSSIVIFITGNIFL